MRAVPALPVTPLIPSGDTTGPPEATPPSPAPPLWTRSFLLLMAANVFYFLGFQLLLPTLPVFAIDLGGASRPPVWSWAPSR